MSQINVVAIITPAEGKTAQVIEAFAELSKYVEKNEPGTLKYEITRGVDKNSGVEDVVVSESYKDKAASDTHTNSEALKAFVKKAQDEGLLGKAPVVKVLKKECGFSRL